ncbi:hypothetical protein HW132_36035 [Brasilonema sp. CT11]|nr:hypothetical protein [Brasilonema sp. CT11]
MFDMTTLPKKNGLRLAAPRCANRTQLSELVKKKLSWIGQYNRSFIRRANFLTQCDKAECISSSRKKEFFPCQILKVPRADRRNTLFICEDILCSVFFLTIKLLATGSLVPFFAQ